MTAEQIKLAPLTGDTGDDAEAISAGTGQKLPVASVGPSPFTSIEGAGHSYMYGDYATGRHGYLAKLGAILGLAPTNRGVEGAQLACDNNAPVGNGAITVFQNLPRANGGAPYLQASSLHLVDFGINDLGLFGAGPAAILGFKSALRATLSRIRAASTGVFEDGDASVTYTGANWAALGSTTINSGTSFHYNTANGQTATIAVPADFPGGTIAVGLIAQAATSGIHTFTLDAGAAGVLDTRNLAQTVAGKANPNAIPVVQRLTGLAPGAHTIVDTLSAITSLGMFDYWQIEAPEPPTILLLTQPRLTPAGYAVYTTAGAPVTPNDAMVGALNVAIRQVAAEFDSKVIVVELDALMGANAALFATTAPGPTGPIHPNDAGHSLIAAACVRALTAQGAWNTALATAS